jgi:hypothetical protein
MFLIADFVWSSKIRLKEFDVYLRYLVSLRSFCHNFQKNETPNTS